MFSCQSVMGSVEGIRTFRVVSLYGRRNNTSHLVSLSMEDVPFSSHFIRELKYLGSWSDGSHLAPRSGW